MGFKFYRRKIILRRNIMLKATRKAKKLFKKEKITMYDIRQMLSYLGWIDCTDTYNMYEKYIKHGKITKEKINFAKTFLYESKSYHVSGP